MLLDPGSINLMADALAGAVEANDIEDAVRLSGKLSSPRIARELRSAPAEFISAVLMEMEAGRAGRVLGHLPYETAREIFDAHGEKLVAMFSAAPIDQAVDILQHFPQEAREALLSQLGAEKRDELLALSLYEAGTSGSVMTSRFLAIDKERTVKETVDALLAGSVETERTAYVYVQSEKGVLLGVVSLKDLMQLDPSEQIARVMNRNVVTVRTDDPAEDAAGLLRDRRFAAMPVVNEDDCLVGVITFEDAMDIMSEKIAESFVSVGGPSDESFFTPPLGAVKRRLPWMAMNVFLNLGAVMVITGFEATIAQVAILAAFLPMITDMGGNVGIQALSVTIRSQALGESKLRDFARNARKELIIGCVNGISLGLVFFFIALAWRGHLWLGALAGIALGINVLIAGIVGGCLPFFIKAIGKDPAMMTGPFLTTITDISGVAIYLGLCTLFLTYLLS